MAGRKQSPGGGARRWPVRIFVLSRFGVVRAGRDCSPSGRPAELLRALIGLGGRAVPEERLHEALWPDSDGDRAHQAFATNLHRLRRALACEGALHLRDGRLTLDGRLCWVDCWALERALGRAERCWEAARGGPEAVRCADRALALVGGPLFASHPDDRWIAPLRERLRSRFLRCVERLGEHWESRGRWADALACWRRGLEADGLAEELWLRQMDCLARLGRPAEALAAYQRMGAVLAEVLGTGPSQATRALAERLRGQAAPA